MLGTERKLTGSKKAARSHRAAAPTLYCQDHSIPQYAPEQLAGPSSGATLRATGQCLDHPQPSGGQDTGTTTS